MAPKKRKTRESQSDNREAALGRTGARQPVHFFRHGVWHLKVAYAPYPGARGDALKMVSSTHAGYGAGQWATQEAAIAAKPHFKEWVDTNMNPLKRTAGATSVVARAAAAKSAATNPRLPVRFRGGVRLESAT
eukprot:2024482-Prymnesium_polylepis.2